MLSQILDQKLDQRIFMTNMIISNEKYYLSFHINNDILETNTYVTNGINNKMKNNNKKNKLNFIIKYEIIDQYLLFYTIHTHIFNRNLIYSIFNISVIQTIFDIILYLL